VQAAASLLQPGCAYGRPNLNAPSFGYLETQAWHLGLS
jgi:hypothetical protein